MLYINKKIFFLVIFKLMKFDEYLTDEITLRNRQIRNKTTLGVFLFVCISALIMKLIDGFLLDLGFRHGELHTNFWDAKNVTNWIPQDINNKYYKSSIETVAHHPNTIWFLTQFTWLTTIIIILFLTIRFLQIGDIVPKWMRWIMTQRTLALVTMYDFVVAIIFWTTLASKFQESFEPDLFAFEILITVLVHAFIPFLIITYSIIFLIQNDRASLLKESFVIKGMIFPICYCFFYIIGTIIWDDPYPVTSMHKQLINGDFSLWAEELWKLPVALLIVYSCLGFLTMMHNIMLLKLNKSYRVENDYEAKERKERKVEKIKNKVATEFAKEMRQLHKKNTGKFRKNNQKQK